MNASFNLLIAVLLLARSLFLATDKRTGSVVSVCRAIADTGTATATVTTSFSIVSQSQHLPMQVGRVTETFYEEADFDFNPTTPKPMPVARVPAPKLNRSESDSVLPNFAVRFDTCRSPSDCETGAG